MTLQKYAAMSLLHNETEAALSFVYNSAIVWAESQLQGASKWEANLCSFYRCISEIFTVQERRKGTQRKETQVNWVFNQHRKTSWTKWKTCSYKNLAWLKVKIIQRNHDFFSFTEKKKQKRWQWRQKSKFQRVRKSQILISQTQSCISAVLRNPRYQGESGVKPVQCEHVVLGKTWVGWRRWEGKQILTEVDVSGLVSADILVFASLCC